ncbi:isochorismatase family protein [Secundilactobacillus odoratitofui]|uniref:isochorismatase family protein n=1 Tax=Secundilactobacillus odoratitofui TaxID=480930 RepID=UPI000A83C514|nr:isochorismatase family protein [Secundilactobacillus odoratitofui]
MQLRRRGIDTIILGGISTSNGVYATALDAYQNAYRLIVVEDACMDRDAEKHAFFFDKMFNRISYVTTTSDLLASF